MLAVGSTMKVAIYVNQDTGGGRGFLREEVLNFVREAKVGVASATVLHPYAGFGSHGKLHKADEGDVAGLHLPEVIVLVRSHKKVDAILPALLELVTDGLVDAHPTEVLKAAAAKEAVIC